jgi:hypothetical protein
MSLYKIPSFEAARKRAEDYAEKSINHTHDYAGWDDQYKKKSRITIGRFGQEWLIEYCQLNGLEYKADKSSYTESDDFDVEICGKVMDVKTSISEAFTGQVSPGCRNKTHINAFCFFLTNHDLSFIEPLGFMQYEDFWSVCTHIGFGQEIRRTGITNRFRGGSYFVETDLMSDFFYFVDCLNRNWDIVRPVQLELDVIGNSSV